MSNCTLIYRMYDDNEEKHYVSSSLDHQRLEEIVNEYKKKKEKILTDEFINYLTNYDPEAHEVEVRDFYF